MRVGGGGRGESVSAGVEKLARRRRARARAPAAGCGRAAGTGAGGEHRGIGPSKNDARARAQPPRHLALHPWASGLRHPRPHGGSKRVACTGRGPGEGARPSERSTRLARSRGARALAASGTTRAAEPPRPRPWRPTLPPHHPPHPPHCPAPPPPTHLADAVVQLDQRLLKVEDGNGPRLWPLGRRPKLLDDGRQPGGPGPAAGLGGRRVRRVGGRADGAAGGRGAGRGPAGGRARRRAAVQGRVHLCFCSHAAPRWIKLGWMERARRQRGPATDTVVGGVGKKGGDVGGRRAVLSAAHSVRRKKGVRRKRAA
jgi:hypothetical protein